MPPERLVIASRESRLAMWQAKHVRAVLLRLYPHYEITILGMATKGYQLLDKSLSKIGGKGLFIKELENALEDGRAGLAVHSLKDVPMEMPDGFELTANLEREDPADVEQLSPPRDLLATYQESAERQVSRRLGGSCEIPIAAYATWGDCQTTLHLKALVANMDGTHIIESSSRGLVKDSQQAINLGNMVADALIKDGAEELIADLGK